MNDRSGRDPQRESSHRNRDSKRVHITDRPPRHQVIHQVYTRLPGSIPSNYYDSPSAPFIWEYSDDSSSAQCQGSSAGLSQEQTDCRIEEWMERMNTNEQATSARRPGDTVYAEANPFPKGINPNTVAPSVVESHYSGESLLSRPTSPVCPPPVLRRSPGQEPVVLRPPGYVPPERRAERERANQVIVSENSERRRRRREERDRDRRHH